MTNNKKEAKKAKKTSTKKFTGLDIDKMEYQEIVLSNTNFPEKSFYKRDY